MTSSPFLTVNGAFSPLWRRLASPTDRTLPRLGFSLAESGRTMPLLVLLSASTRLTRILSPRGRSFAMSTYSLTGYRGRSNQAGASPHAGRFVTRYLLLVTCYLWALAIETPASVIWDLRTALGTRMPDEYPVTSNQ